VYKESIMERTEKEVLQVSKEIAVKFIETQRISPANFSEIFPSIYNVVFNTVMHGQNVIQSVTNKKD